MLRIYGSMLCKDCVQCRADLDNAGVAYDYLDFSEDLCNLKEFLALRDQCQVLQSAKENGAIGIPCLVDDEGVVSLDWSRFL